MKQPAKPKTKRIKATTPLSKNAILLKAIEELYSRGEKYPTLPLHTQPGPRDPFAYVLTHTDTTRTFAALCKTYGCDFRQEVNKALKLHMSKMAKRPVARKKHRERKERGQDRAMAIMGPFVEEIIDRSKGEAKSRLEVSAAPAKFITDADFLAGLHIKDDGLAPA